MLFRDLTFETEFVLELLVLSTELAAVGEGEGDEIKFVGTEETFERFETVVTELFAF